MIKSSTSVPFALPYGDLERLIGALTGARSETIRSRFRKLRQRPFPDDDMQSGTGVRVKYDLRRTLALIATFELNDLCIPQGQAVEVVRASWPEWCRAMIAAAADAGLIGEPAHMPSDAGPILELGCSAVSSEESIKTDSAATRQIDLDALMIRPAIAINVSRILASLISWAETQGPDVVVALGSEMAELEKDFGWSRPTVNDADMEAMRRGRSFMDEGPFFERALALLAAQQLTPSVSGYGAERVRLQRIYRYLAQPAPIDLYKQHIGFDGTERLAHYLHFHARDLGLDTLGQYPEVYNVPDLRARALGMIHCAEQGRGRSKLIPAARH